MGSIEIPAQAEVIAKALAPVHRVGLFCHIMPDGDTIGSALALSAGLRSLGKSTVVFSADGVPKAYSFLPGAEEIVASASGSGGPAREGSSAARFEAAVFLDCTQAERAGGVLEVVGPSTVIVNLDHHITNSGFGHHRWVDPGAAATGEMVYWVLRALGVEIAADVATCLYVAILSDTGRFSYDNTGPGALRVCADLIERGVRPYAIAEELYESKSVASLRLLALALSTLAVSEDGRVAWLEVTRDMLREAGATEDETEGIVNFSRTIKGVKVGLLFRETADGRVRVAFRSRSEVDVSKIALKFGGGGHSTAAGCAVRGTLEEVKKSVLAETACAVRDLDPEIPPKRACDRSDQMGSPRVAGDGART